MKFTLLEITQDILNDIDGDEVDSIFDTTEATQIANIVRSTYNHIVSQRDLPEHKGLVNLDVTAATTPVLMTTPDDILRLEWLKYDAKLTGETDSAFQTLSFLDFKEFLDLTNQFDSDSSIVDEMTFTDGNSGTFTVKYKNNRAPTCFTVKDDYNFIFDSVNKVETSGTLAADPITTAGSTTISIEHTAHGRVVGDYVTFSGADTVDGIDINDTYTVASVTDVDNYTFTHADTASGSSTGGGSAVAYIYHTDVDPLYLQSSKVQAYGLLMPTFTISDSFTPDIDATEFSWLIEESKSACSIKLRQVQDPKAEQRARRGWVRSQKGMFRLPHKKFFHSLPDYGRK